MEVEDFAAFSSASFFTSRNSAERSGSRSEVGAPEEGITGWRTLMSVMSWSGTSNLRDERKASRRHNSDTQSEWESRATLSPTPLPMEVTNEAQLNKASAKSSRSTSGLSRTWSRH